MGASKEGETAVAAVASVVWVSSAEVAAVSVP